MNCSIPHRSSCQKAATCIKLKKKIKIFHLLHKKMAKEFRGNFKLLKLLRSMPRSTSKVDQYSQRNSYWTFGKRFEKDKISYHKLSCKSATKFFVKSKFITPKAERRMKKANLKEDTYCNSYVIFLLMLPKIPDSSFSSTRSSIKFYSKIRPFLEIQSKNIINVTFVAKDKC